MTTISFEYCSLYYLNQWLTNDKEYCEVLSSNDQNKKLAILKKAAAFYRVARNIPTEYDLKKGLPRYKPVLDILDTVNKNDFDHNAINKILEIERKISNEYGNTGVLSLTTKFLWLKVKKPVIIYDSQAKQALNITNTKLHDYYLKWNKSFESHKKEIERVCSNLPELHLYTVDQHIGTKEYIQTIVSKRWFHERVFDIYLWHK